MRAARALTAWATACVLSACGGPVSPGPGGFASYVGVLGCADVAAWGTVTGSEAVDEGLEVTVAVAERVYPATSPDVITFVADDPAREVGAPAWAAAQDRVLVIVSERAPAARLDVAEGGRAVQQWRGAGSPRLSDDECGRA